MGSRTAAVVAGWAAVAACDAGPVVKVGDGSSITQPQTTSDTATGPDQACDERDENGSCTLYTGAQWDPASVANDCQGDLVTSCPAADLGTCTFEPTGPLAQVVSYYSGTYYDTSDVPYLSSSCYQSYGDWQ